MLSNTTGRDVEYEIEILQPHPYFKIDPCFGVISANKKQRIQVSYSPITLGSSTTVLRLSLKNQHGCHPKDCVVSACALSGKVNVG